MFSTEEAAQRLDVTAHRVRALIAAGTLKAERFADRWAIDEDSLAMLEARHRKTGHRSMSTRVAWGAAAILDGDRPTWLSSSERSRLKRLLERGADVDTWIARLAARSSDTLDVRVHDDIAKDFIDDTRVKRSGTNSLLTVGDDLVGGTKRLNVWSSTATVRSLRRDYGLLRSSKPTLRVRVVPDDIFTALGAQREVYRLIVAADLWDDGDARSRRLAAELIGSTGARDAER